MSVHNSKGRNWAKQAKKVKNAAAEEDKDTPYAVLPLIKSLFGQSCCAYPNPEDRNRTQDTSLLGPVSTAVSPKNQK